MGLTVTDQPLCPSCACHRECQGFQKLAELKDAGLVVYCHNKRTKDVRQDSAVDQTDTSQNVFILHNTKDVKLISADLKSELEKTDICCPRCRKAYQQVQKLMQKVTSIDRKKVMGLCDHCRKRAEKKKKTCSTCEEIVKKFMSVKGQQKEDTKQFIKIWLSKMGVYFKQPMKIDQRLLDEIAPGHKDTAEYLDLNLDQLPQKSSLPKHLPEVKEMFISEAHKPDSESNIDTNLQKRPKVQLVDVNPPTALSDMSLLRKPHEGEAKVPVSEPVFVQSDMTFMERHSRVNQQIKSSLKEKEELKKYDDTLKHAKEAIKKRHDLSLRQMTHTEKEPLPRRPQVYEIPKVAPWEKDYDSKYYDESETDIKLKKAYVIRSQESLSVKDVQYEAARPTQKDLRDRQGKHEHHKIKKGTQDFDEGVNITQELTDENELQTIHDRAKSKHRLPGHKTGHKKTLGSKRTAENIAKTRFSFFFPKLPVEEKKPVIDTHSSHLIQLTQEKFRLQAEKEEENKRMRQEKKKQAQIEKEKIARYEYEQELARANAEKYLKDKESRKQSDTIQTTDKVEELEKIKKDLKVELEEKYGIDEQSGKAKRDSRSKPGQKGKDGKVDEISDKIKKDDQSKSEDIYETDKLSERAKKDIKSERDEKSAIGEEGEKAQKGIKSERDEKSAIGEEGEKAQKGIKSERDDKSAIEVGEKAQKGIKSERDEKSAIGKVGEKAQKGIKSERDEKSAIGEFGEKAQKGVKSKQDDKFALGEVGEKAKKDVKSKHEEKYVSDKVSEKAKKDGKAGPDQIVGIDEKSEKTKRDTKSKYEQNAEFEKEGEKSKKDAIKAKSEQGKLDEYGKVEKGLKSTPEKPVKLDGASQTTKKDLKISEAKAKGETSKEKGTKIGDLKEKDELKIKKDMRKKDNILEEAIKKDLQGRSDKRSKTEVSDKDKTEVSDKDKSKLKSKPDKKGKSGDADVLKKDVTSKSELKDKQHGAVDKEQAKRDALTQKQLEKQEHEDKIKREKEKKEDQERLKMVEQLHKDKESAKAQAAKDAGKELTAEEPGKKKGKKASSKKSEADKVSLIEIKASQKSLKATKSLDTHPKLSKGELLRIAKEKELEAKKNKAMAADAAEFRKLQEQLVKEKEKAYAARRADSQRRLKRLDVNAIFGTGAKRSERKRKISIKKRELKPFNVLKSVRVKPGLSPSQRRLPKNMDPQLMKEHRRHQLSGQKCPTCILCCDSELEMTFESYLIQLKKRVKHIIIGERIYKNKQMVEKEQEPKNVPMLFHTGVNKHIQAKTDKDALDDELDSESLKKKIVPVSSKKV